MLAALHRQLRDGGRLVIVEYYKSPDAMPGGRAMQHIRLDAADVIKEIESNHFRLLSQHDHVKGSQYMAIFEKKIDSIGVTYPATGTLFRPRP